MKRRLTILGMALLLLAVTTSALAAVTGYDLSWWTADGGGGASTGEGYSLNGTIGQPDAGPVLSGGSYRLESGFWGGGMSGESQNQLFLPLVRKHW